MREGPAFHLLTKHTCDMILNRDRTIAVNVPHCHIFNDSFFFPIPLFHSSQMEPPRDAVIEGGDNTDLQLNISQESHIET